MRHFTAFLVFMFAFCQMAEARVFSTLKGDANGDGDVNVADAALMVNNMLGTPSNNFIAANADVNSDGEVNVSDVAAVIAMIMEGGGEMGPGDAQDPDVNGN